MHCLQQSVCSCAVPVLAALLAGGRCAAGSVVVRARAGAGAESMEISNHVRSTLHHLIALECIKFWPPCLNSTPWKCASQATLS
jgi:hypothetical protein